ncbi:hypothetical protein DE146DRAFT_607505 [Phaeosphaeria sp. MPI-PUGE-AT-0046c]|nr:hypothetical protein DE146DRAFT_607505 [Phaeosphaeria sp. MPI-PUGE-AT-0046c]
MSEATETPNRRRTRDERESISAANEEGGRKRRAFLQTMGQQLREFGVDGTSPQDHSRNTFVISPSSHPRPASRANVTAVHGAPSHVDTPESDRAPGEDDQLPMGAAKSASKWLWRPSEVLPPTPSSIALELQFDDLLDWSQSYIDHWHPAFPFLHAPSLIDYMRQVAGSGLQRLDATPSDTLQYIVLRSIMSISVADRRQMAGSHKIIPSRLVFHSFNDAINSIQLVLTEESSVLSLQALVSEVELRKRLFWSIYCIDRYICIRLGTPLGVRSDETNMCFPHDERHCEHPASAIEHDDRLSLLEFLARHASIRGSIMENRVKSSLKDENSGVDEIMEVEAEHTRWWNTVDEYLSDDDGTRSIIKAHQVTLIVLRFESVLALHRSVLATSKKNSAYNAALQRCISASRSIINTLHKAIKGFGAFDGSPGQHGYEHLPLLWPSFTWAVWMSVFIIVFASSEGQFARDTALRLTDRSIQILQHLALRGTNWPEACIVAVQNLSARLREGSTRSSTAAPGQGSKDASRSTTTDPVASSARTNDVSNFGQFERQRSGHVTPRGQAMVPLGLPQHVTAQSSAGNYANMDPFAQFNNPGGSAANAYFNGAGNFLGIAQQSSDNPMPNDEIMHLFNGEDMGFWSGINFGYGGGFGYQESFH